ncbi:hypothetical protein V0M98_37460 (plasmid) [Pseudomonas silesiensis]|uniref:hypothetical protein n=1 Tax=Pseudomonas silesiensis TaxID=1853130 RepID=UPI0030D39BE1
MSLKLKRLLNALFPKMVVVPASTSKATSMALANKIVRLYSRSNLNLQRGRYVTAEQLEDRKRQLAKHSF